MNASEMIEQMHIAPPALPSNTKQRTPEMNAAATKGPKRYVTWDGSCGVPMNAPSTSKQDNQMTTRKFDRQIEKATKAAIEGSLAEIGKEFDRRYGLAAAPDLFEAAVSLIASLDPATLNPEQFNAWCGLNAVLTKAEGRS